MAESRSYLRIALDCWILIARGIERGDSGMDQKQGKDRRSTSRSQADLSARRQNEILIIEDNKPDVFLMQEALTVAGIDSVVHVVHDGAAAIHFIDSTDNDDHAPCPDVVLLDLNLPKASGGEVLRRMRASRRFRGTPVVIVTSSNSDKDRALLSELGANEFFQKAASYAEFMKLGSLVKELLNESESSDDDAPACF